MWAVRKDESWLMTSSLCPCESDSLLMPSMPGAILPGQEQRQQRQNTLPTWKPKTSQPSQEILTGFSTLLIEMFHRGSLWVHLFWVSTLVIINSHIQFCMHQLIEILLKADAKETTKDIIHMYWFLLLLL